MRYNIFDVEEIWLWLNEYECMELCHKNMYAAVLFAVIATVAVVAFIAECLPWFQIYIYVDTTIKLTTNLAVVFDFNKHYFLWSSTEKYNPSMYGMYGMYGMGYGKATLERHFKFQMHMHAMYMQLITA